MWKGKECLGRSSTSVLRTGSGGPVRTRHPDKGGPYRKSPRRTPTSSRCVESDVHSVGPVRVSSSPSTASVSLLVRPTGPTSGLGRMIYHRGGDRR